MADFGQRLGRYQFAEFLKIDVPARNNCDDWPFASLSTQGCSDWQSARPRLRWQQRVGPGWSSVVVIGDRLFTQEQLGQKEAVVCYRAATGKVIWTHEYDARFRHGVPWRYTLDVVDPNQKARSLDDVQRHVGRSGGDHCSLRICR